MGGYSAFILRRPSNEDSFSFIAFTLPSTRYTLLAIRPLIAALFEDVNLDGRVAMR
jgi:hypothetical protein